MELLRAAGIRGTGSYLPEKVLDNATLEKMVDTSDEWITTRTGIKERRVVPDHQATSDLAIEAARRAIEAAALGPNDIDLIIVATITSDCLFPAVAVQVQNALGCERAGGFDISSACAGFISALTTGWQFVRSGAHDNVLVIGAETLTRIVNYEDRTSCILFGDGAGAVVLSSEFERGELLGSFLRVDGSGYEIMWVPAGGSRTPLTPQLLEQHRHCMHIRGREVYKFAVNRMVELVMLEKNRNPHIPLGLVIPHQVNMRIIESARERLELSPERVITNIERVGNTSAASIPIAFDEAVRSGRLDRELGKLVVFCAFGAGLSWGSISLRW
ncbi:MAG: beta-ketoacyl-ACP synthase III [Planctomycetota bacterium]